MKVILLTKGYCAIISKEDWKRVKKYSWYTHMSAGSRRKPGQPYARAFIKGKKIYLHRFITAAELPFHVDHDNHQTLDCRRQNLIVKTPAQNMLNRRKKKCLKN